MRKFQEKIVVSDGKLQYAIALHSENREEKDTYILMRNGEVYFNSNWFSSVATYDGSEESHSIAKEIFTSQLKAAVKTRVGELKLLESVLADIGISDMLGTSLTEAQKMLIDQKINEVKEEVRGSISDAIVENVKPIAIKKTRAKKAKGEA